MTMNPEKVIPNLMPQSIFIHIPKTGGTWVREHFNEQGWWESLGFGHFSLDEIYRVYPRLKGRPSFAFVRHPVDLLMSYWGFATLQFELGQIKASTICFHAKQAKTRPDLSMRAQLYVMLYGLWSPDINRYFRNVIETLPDYIDDHYAHYTKGVSWVGKTECIADDLARFMDYSGDKVDIDLIRSWNDRRNTSTLDGQKVSRSLADAVVDLSPWACSKFGYNRDNGNRKDDIDE